MNVFYPEFLFTPRTNKKIMQPSLFGIILDEIFSEWVKLKEDFLLSFENQIKRCCCPEIQYGPLFEWNNCVMFS